MVVVAKGRKGQYSANAEYLNGSVILKKGSMISLEVCNRKLPMNVERLRSDSSIVNSEGVILTDITFTTPSMAATFVTGNISNGFRVWKTEDGKKLGDVIAKEKK